MPQPVIQLANHVAMPQLGLGVWQAKNGDEVCAAVLAAIKAGYRLIDTASAYGNEKGVGRAIKDSGVDRSQLFVTTKLWNADQGYDKTLAAYQTAVQQLGLDYVDLYLIHWPAPSKDNYIDSWRAMETLYKDGRVRAIGVSNFTISHLKRLQRETTIVPMVNQIEIHPYYQQTELRAYCAAHNISVESYSPLGGKSRRGGNLLQEPMIKRIASSYNVSPAQVIIKWHLEQGLIVIPKSVRPVRIKENYDVFGFHLTQPEMTIINKLETGTRVGADPDTTNLMLPTPLVQLAHNFGLVHW